MKYTGKQCKQCPFRASSLPGWLGSYTPGDVFRSIWHGEPFFCHTKIDYTREDWLERAMKPRGGPLCTGGLAFANKLHAPRSVHLPIVQGREAVKLLEGTPGEVECMDPRAFGAHHEKSLAEQIDEIKDRLGSKLAAKREAAKVAARDLALTAVDALFTRKGAP